MGRSEQVQSSRQPARDPVPGAAAALGAAVLLLLLAFPVARLLWAVWRESASFSHGPLLALFALGLLWQRRREFRGPASWAGLALLLPAGLIYVFGFAGDVDLFKSLGLVGLFAGAAWVARGLAGMRAAGPGLGLLLFTIPWPTALMERLAFPAQMMSSCYAAMLAGLLGQRVHRAGVHLSAMGPDGEPIYYIFVTRACSGLTSLVVLLALAYLVAYLTPGSWGRRLGLFAAALPLSVLANAIRLVLILLAGTHGSKELATWIHDHETPVLVTLCLLALLGIRRLLLGRDASPAGRQEYPLRQGAKGPAAAALQHPQVDREGTLSTGSKRAKPAPTALLSTVLLLALGGREWGLRAQTATLSSRDFLRGVEIPFQDWTTEELNLSRLEREDLQPESVLIRRYTAPDGRTLDLSVIAGRRKSTIHSPGSCFVGCGWERLLESRHTLQVDGREIPTTRALLLFSGKKILLTFLFTDGDYTTSSLMPFQGVQLAKRLLPDVPMQAVLRITTPVEGDTAAEEALSDAFLRHTLPPLMHELRTAGRGPETHLGLGASLKGTTP